MALSSFNDRIRSLQRLLVGHADDVELDGAGRILVPPALRQYAALDKHVVLVGQGNKFELWDEARWTEQTAQAIAFPRRAAARARRLLALMTGWRAMSRSCSKKPWRRWRSSRTAIYVDGTFGRGGHSERILAALGPAARSSRSTAIPQLRPSRARGATRAFAFIAHGFRSCPASSIARHCALVDGVLLDLGIASPQIDDPTRGFSLRADGPLDMRMDPSRGQSAAEWLSHVTERELRGVIADYGEERFAQQIARAIVAARAHEPILRTRQLAAIVAKAVGSRGRGDWSQDPATRTFQAVRIFINQELQELPLALDRILPRLRDRRPVSR